MYDVRPTSPTVKFVRNAWATTIAASFKAPFLSCLAGPVGNTERSRSSCDPPPDKSRWLGLRPHGTYLI